MKGRQEAAGILLVLLTMLLFIFFMSAKPAPQSAELSLQVDRWLCSLLVSDYETLSEGQQQAEAAALDLWVRKSAYVLEYTALGALLWMAARRLVRNKASACAMTLFAGLCQAGLDEMHQLFVPGRAGRMLDVCLDSAGVLLGMGLAMVLHAACQRIRARREGRKKRKQL